MGTNHTIEKGPSQLAFWANVGLRGEHIFHITIDGQEVKVKVIIDSLTFVMPNVLTFKGRDSEHVDGEANVTGSYNPSSRLGTLTIG